jgi:flagellar protein FliS
MASPAREKYLAAEVLTASPQRLHLMLLEAAVCFAERARHCWRAKQPAQATEAIVHAEEIVGELLAGLNREIGGDLVSKTAAVYLFVFRSLMEANAGKDEGRLDEALKVLQIERETWRRVCEQIGAADPSAKAIADGVSLHRAETLRPPAAPPLPVHAPRAEQRSGRLSLDA